MKVVHLDRREGIVATLEGVLEKARTGEVTGVAMAFQFGKEGVGTVYQVARDGNLWMLLGAVDELHQRIVTSS